jgi:CO dehydrogenase maturation factor
MKFACTGKGGVGKTTIAALMAHYFNKDGYRVLAVDADPVAHLAIALGIPPDHSARIIPISEQRRLIRERTGADPRQFGQLFKLNPTVNDIPDKFCVEFRGIKLLVMGAVQKGGSGCACPENVLLRSLLSEVILQRQEVVMVDMEAGIEHLGRATCRSIDKMLIVVEPSLRSVGVGKNILALAEDIGLESFGIIGNKIQNPSQEEWLRAQFPVRPILGMISYREILRDSDFLPQPLIDSLDEPTRAEFEALYRAIRQGLPAS